MSGAYTGYNALMDIAKSKGIKEYDELLYYVDSVENLKTIERNKHKKKWFASITIASPALIIMHNEWRRHKDKG